MIEIKKYLDSIGIECTKDMLDSFEIYYQELIIWNNKFNLTAITERDEVIIKHFIDSLTAVKYIKPNARIIDIGSGAGFPAIPLKIVRPDIEITMLDSLNKRVNYLNHMIDRLKLSKAIAIHSRAEDLARGSERASYDYVTARAVAGLNILLEYSISYLKVGGEFIAYKSIESDEEINVANNALNVLKCKIKIIDTFYLPNTDISRTLIIIEKQHKTDKLYPRENNLPRKKPL